MYCQKCGTQLEEGAKFCPKCGAAQTVATTPTTPADLSVAVPAASAGNVATNPGTTANANAAEPQEFNFQLTKHLLFGMLGPYKTTYTDIIVQGDTATVHKYNRTFLIKNGTQDFSFKINDVVSILPTKKLSWKMIFNIIFGVIVIISAIAGGILWAGVIGLLMIIMGVAEFHDYFMTINFGSGTLSVPNEIKDQCAELQAYLVQRNPKIQVIKNY